MGGQDAFCQFAYFSCAFRFKARIEELQERMEKLKKELKKQKDKESSLLEEKDKLKQVPRQCPTFILERTLHLRKERVLIDTENTCLLFPTRFLQWSCNCYLRPRPNVELFIRDEPNTNLGRPKLS